VKLLLFGIRFLLGALLLYSGLGEIRQPFDFLASVQAYQLTGPVSGLVAAGVVPWVEAVVGICLIAGLFTRGALAAAILLTCVFSVAVTSAWYRGLGINCGCFGGGADGRGDVIGVMTVLRSLALVGLAVAGLVMSRGEGAPRPNHVFASLGPFDRLVRGRAKFFDFDVSSNGARPQSSGKAPAL
jgi:uncharacterized membrane protein YphA (DoxX/SURF4 family)